MKILQWIVFALLSIGFLHRLITHPMSFVGPLLFIGIGYYLYRYPPMWLMRMTSSTPPPKKKKKRPIPFKVFSGKK